MAERAKLTDVTKTEPSAPPKQTITLPTEKAKPSGRLEDKTILIYGPPKIGKSTLVSEMDDVLFLDTEGGLGELEVFSIPIGDWPSFLEACRALVDEGLDRFKAVCIDTIDVLSLYCSAFTNQQLGISHESESDYGKGWARKRDEFMRPLMKLASIPNLGLILVAHDKEREVKTRSRVVDKHGLAIGGSAGDALLGFADLILFCDTEVYTDEDGNVTEQRLLRTKPSQFWEAGERGNPPRLPESLPLSWKHLRAAWYGGEIEEAK